MKTSKLVAGALAVAIVGGAAYGITVSGSSMAASPEMVCSSDLLTFTEQNDCKQQVKAANSQAEKKQVAKNFEAKIAAKKNAMAPGAEESGASTSSGGSAMTPSPAAPDANPAQRPDNNVPPQ